MTVSVSHTFVSAIADDATAAAAGEVLPSHWNAAHTVSGLATVASTGAYSDLSGAPTLATVATSGAYSDLTGSPTLATVATSGAYSDLSGQPTLFTGVPGGRLTLETGVPVSTSDQTAKTSIYYTPHVHNSITLWSGSVWTTITFTEYTLALGTVTSGKPYDVFAYLNSGALALEMLVWTNDTTRATAVTLQDGRYCKSGDKTRLYLGTFYTTSTTATEDSVLKRFVWNMYNRTVHKLAYAAGSSNHTYSTATYRAYNNDTGARVQWVQGIAFGSVWAACSGSLFTAVAGNNVRLGLALNSTSNGDIIQIQSLANVWNIPTGSPLLITAAGLNYVQLVEYVDSNTGTLNFGTIAGTVEC